MKQFSLPELLFALDLLLVLHVIQLVAALR